MTLVSGHGACDEIGKCKCDPGYVPCVRASVCVNVSLSRARSLSLCILIYIHIYMYIGTAGPSVRIRVPGGLGMPVRCEGTVLFPKALILKSTLYIGLYVLNVLRH